MSRTGITLAGALVLASWFFPRAGSGQDPDHVSESGDSTNVVLLAPLQVEGRRDDLSGVAVTASQGYVGYRDLRTRPLSREGEMLETVPGMILTQHSGDGKSNQMFVRGFNLDHGTDFQTRVEGMPVNLPTHGHGQGYTDLNFLIPELVDHIDYRLGTYYPELGDFSAAGGAHFRLRPSLDRALARIDVGQNGYLRTVVAASRDVAGGQLLGGGEFRGYDGPWDIPQDLRKVAGALRYTWGSDANTFSVLGLGYDNRWNSSDQIPQRAVDEERISRFAQVDSTLGGSSSRFSLSGSWNRTGRRSSQVLNLYGIYYDLDLYSNFTYFLDDPVEGDQINQVDERAVFGLGFVHRAPVDAVGRLHDFSAGLETRLDLVDVSLHNTRDRERIGTVRSDEVTEWGTGAWVSLKSGWTRHFRTVLGLRGDVYHFDVRSEDARNSGSRSAAIASPKLSLVFGPWGSTELYGSAGLGFHSNDARGTTQSIDPRTGDPVEPVDPLVRSRGAEIGARSSPVEGWRSTFALWVVELDSELLFVGDAGTTEPSDASQRIGLTWTNYWRITERLTVDLDISFTRARIVDAPPGEDRVPGAVENVVAAGITWEPPTGGFFGTARVRHFGAYPLTEDNSRRASPTTLSNLSIGWRIRDTGLRVVASVLNLFNSADDDIQYWYASRGRLEPVGGVEDLHFKPIEPRQLRVSVTWGL